MKLENLWTLMVKKDSAAEAFAFLQANEGRFGDFWAYVRELRESEAELRDELHDAERRIDELETNLDAARARIDDLEAVYEPGF